MRDSSDNGAAVWNNYLPLCGAIKKKCDSVFDVCGGGVFFYYIIIMGVTGLNLFRAGFVIRLWVWHIRRGLCFLPIIMKIYWNNFLKSLYQRRFCGLSDILGKRPTIFFWYSNYGFVFHFR